MHIHLQPNFLGNSKPQGSHFFLHGLPRNVLRKHKEMKIDIIFTPHHKCYRFQKLNLASSLFTPQQNKNLKKSQKKKKWRRFRFKWPFICHLHEKQRNIFSWHKGKKTGSTKELAPAHWTQAFIFLLSKSEDRDIVTELRPIAIILIRLLERFFSRLSRKHCKSLNFTSYSKSLYPVWLVALNICAWC